MMRMTPLLTCSRRAGARPGSTWVPGKPSTTNSTAPRPTTIHPIPHRTVTRASGRQQTDGVAFIAAIDQGTTSSRCIIFDDSGGIVSVDQREHTQIFPRPGWVEHDPAEIWLSVQSCVANALQRAGLSASDLVAIGITNQRETTVLWDRRTGAPVHNAIVWQDTRTDALIADLARDGGQDR